MSEVETPKKIAKKRGRLQKETSVNDNCRFCKRQLTSVGGSNTTFENLFKPSGRQESLNLILADACESVGFKLSHSESLSERVCRPCGRKIRNAVELFNFLKEAVCSTQAKENNIVAAGVDDTERIKRQLPSTVTPERNSVKKSHQEDNENNVKEADTRDKTCRKTLFSDCSEDLKGVSVVNETTPIVLKETETISNENDDFINNLCNIETIIDKKDTQIKVVIVYPNAKTPVVRETFDDLTKGIIKNLALKNWKSAVNQVFKHPELKQSILEETERTVAAEFSNLSKSDTILKGRNVEELIAFSNNILVHEASVLCPLWYFCLKGACGKGSANSNNPFRGVSYTNAMALATASVARSRNPTLSAFAYRVSAILFHGGTKHDDILRLNRLGLCMSPEMTVNFQRQLGQNFDSKILMWKKTTEENLSSLNMLKIIKAEQVKELAEDDMEIPIPINLEETAIKSYPGVDPLAFDNCTTKLQNVQTRAEQSAIDSDTLDVAIKELKNTNLPTFKIVGDNIDHTVHARIQSKDSTNQSLHWTHQYAVLGRAKNPSLDNTMPQKEIKNIQPVELLPSREVQQRLKNRWAILVSRVVCKYIHPLKYLHDVVLYHIPHTYSREMCQKSEICCLGLQFQNPNVASEMADLLIANQENYVPKCQLVGNEKKILRPIPFHGDQLFEERARNTKWTYQDGINEYDKLEGLQTEAADWHAKVNLYEVNLC